MNGVPYFTTLAAAKAAVGAIEERHERPTGVSVRSLQEYHEAI
jgi:hypothetical protein